MLINNLNFSTINGNRRELDRSLERLSTGSRVNRSRDDAAAMSISSRFTTIHNSLLQSSRNINDGIGLVQTVDSALEAQGGLVVRMRELLVQANNETYNATDRNLIRGELVDLRREYERISNSTEFNGIDLMGSSNVITIQVGEFNTAEHRLDIDLSRVFSQNDVIGSSAYFGDLTRQNGIGGTATSGINQGTEFLGSYSDSFFVGEMNEGIGRMDILLSVINNRRSTVGAYQNRLEFALNNNRSYEMNLMSSSSQMTAVDYAQQTSELVRHQVQMNAGVASMAQAKGMSANILSLL